MALAGSIVTGPKSGRLLDIRSYRMDFTRTFLKSTQDDIPVLLISLIDSRDGASTHNTLR